MLKARVLTALFLLFGFLSVVFLLPVTWAVWVFAIVTTLAAWEWAGLLRAPTALRQGFAAAVLLSCIAFGQNSIAHLLWWVALVFWLVVPLLLRTNWRPGASGYLLGWLLLLATWTAIADLLQRSPWLLLLAMALVWVADSGAYFAGRAFGRHKLAPAISPGKTWEGVAGGVAGVLLCGFVVRAAYPGDIGVSGLGLALFLVALTAFSILGDLLESMLKRQAGLKDSGSLLPGHGGVLDRIDSQLSVLPLAALCLHWIGP